MHSFPLLVCTLPHGHFEKIDRAQDVSIPISSIQNCDPMKFDLATAYHLTHTNSALAHIQILLLLMATNTSSSSQPTDIITIAGDTQTDAHFSTSETDRYWTEYSRVILRRKE